MQIELLKVSKSYKDASDRLVVIDQLSYTFASKQHAVIMGRSGVGKSTLLHILGGLDSPSSGAVRVGEQDITQLGSDERSDFRSKQVGFIFQFHHLLPDFSALENVAMPLYIQGQSVEHADEQASAILARVGMDHRLKHRPGELSGGEQQRVAVARALVNKPSVVLADEPTGSLDQKTGAVVKDLLLEICSELGASLIVVTHSKEFASGFNLLLEMQPGGALHKVN